MSQYKLDDACDKTLKMRMDSTSTSRGWTETAAGLGEILSYGTNAAPFNADNNVYRSVQLEKGTFTLSLKSNGIVNDKYYVKLVDVTNETHVLLSRYAKIGQNAKFVVTVDTYRQCKLVIAKENAADEITEIAIHSGAPTSLLSAADYTTLEFVDIPQSVDTDDTPIEPETGDGYTGYTPTGQLQVAFKMKDVDVKDCEYVYIKFAEPVPESGWMLSFTGDTIDLPKGATEYTFVFTDSIRASGTLPECTLFTRWWGEPSQQIKVAGVYKAHVTKVIQPVEMVEIPQTGMADGMAKEEGDGWSGYKASNWYQVAYKMENVDVTGYESVLVKFAEPVPDSGWWLAYNGTIDLPKGATEYNYIFPASIRASGVLPECTLLTSWGVPEHQIKVAGVYKVPAQNEVDEIPSTFADRGHLKRIVKGATYTAEASMQTVLEAQDLRVNGCDYILVKFAEPVGPDWSLALEGIDGYIRIPEGASGYRLDLDASAVASGTVPKLALVALGQGLPQTIHLEGVYRHSLVKGFAIHLC